MDVGTLTKTARHCYNAIVAQLALSRAQLIRLEHLDKPFDNVTPPSAPSEFHNIPRPADPHKCQRRLRLLAKRCWRSRFSSKRCRSFEFHPRACQACLYPDSNGTPHPWLPCRFPTSCVAHVRFGRAVFNHSECLGKADRRVQGCPWCRYGHGVERPRRHARS